MNLLDNTSNQPSKFRVEINDESSGTYIINSQIKSKTRVLNSSLWDYSYAHILGKGNIIVNNTEADGAAANNSHKKITFKNWAPFFNCISEINNTQVDNDKDIDIAMPMYNLLEYNDNYSETSASLWQYYKDIPAVNDNGNIAEFNGTSPTDSFNFKAKITGQTDNNGRIDNVQIMVPLKYLINFWRTLEMPLINCKINLILTWSANCAMIYHNVTNQNSKFEIAETKLYAPVVTLSTQDNAKLLPQLKLGFKRTTNCKKYLSKLELLGQNLNLNHLVEPSFQGVNRLFVLTLENDAQGKSNKTIYQMLWLEKSFFDQSVKNTKITFENIRKTVTGQGDYYTTGCLLDYAHFRDISKRTRTVLSKEQALDANPKTIQQINFIANLDRAGNARIFFILEEAKKTVSDFSQGNLKFLHFVKL